MLGVPEIPHLMLITLMDRFGMKSAAIRQLWLDAYRHWLAGEMKVHHQWCSDRIMEIVYLRVAHVCEPPGERKTSLRYAAAELAQQYVHR